MVKKKRPAAQTAAKTAAKPKTAIEQKPALVLPKHFTLWAIVFLANFFILSGILIQSMGNTASPYYYGPKFLITFLMLLVFTVAIVAGLKKNDTKLLLYTGAAEFAFLFLPLVTMSANAAYLPYVITPVFMFSFPILWTAIPAAMMHLIANEPSKTRFLQTLFSATLFVGAGWLLSGYFALNVYDWRTYEVIGSQLNWAGFTIMFSLLLVPLAIWCYEFRKLTPKRHGEKKASASVMGFIDRNLPEALLVIVIAIIAIIGFALNDSVSRYPQCGDGMCEGYEDSYNCPMDCVSYCGDGWCDYSEDGSESGGYYCPDDCGFPPVPEPPNYVPGEPPGLPPGVGDGLPIGEGELRVYVSGGSGCDELTVALRGEDQTLLAAQTSTSKAFTFAGINAGALYAEVSSSQSNRDQVNSAAIEFPSQNTIRVALPEDYCG